MVNQLADLVSLDFQCNHAIQRSVKEPLAVEQERIHSTQKTCIWGNNPLQMIQNCSDSWGSCLPKVSEPGGKLWPEVD